MDVGLLEVLVDVHDGGHVSASVAVVRSGEYGRYILVVSVGVSLSIKSCTSIIS